MLEYHDALFRRDGEFSRRLPSPEDIFRRDVLILDLIEVLPAHRGRRLGLADAHRLIEMLGGGCGVAAMKPFPLQFQDQGHDDDPGHRAAMKFEAMDRDRARATRKLRGYWGRLGFQRVGWGEFFALNLARVRPALRDLVDESEL